MSLYRLNSLFKFGFIKFIVKYEDLKLIQEILQIICPLFDAYATINGRLLPLSHSSELVRFANITHSLIVNLNLRTRGGKGGFGSLLRHIGSQIEKTKNREACRDLTGRRLRDVHDEQRLRDWLKKAAEKEREKKTYRLRKLETALEKSRATTSGEGTIGSKLDSIDTQYYEQRTKILDELEDALETLTSASFATSSSTATSSGAAAASSSHSSAGSDSTNMYSQLLGRLSETARMAIDVGRHDAEIRRAKRARIADEAHWLGLGDADADALRSSGSSSSESSSEDEDSAENEPLPTLAPEDVSSSTTLIPSSVSICEPSPISEANNASAANASDHMTCPSALPSESNGSINNTQNSTTAEKTSSKTAQEPENTATSAPEQQEANETSESLGSNANAPAAALAVAGGPEFEPLQLKRFRSLDELLALGAAHLAAELRRRGMKCGGTLDERAQRLWLVRNVRHRREIPKYLLAKPSAVRASPEDK